MDKTPTREEAWKLLNEYTHSESLLTHALCVEAVMEDWGERSAPEEKTKWGVIGLVHDLDYEKFPEEHCVKTREILAGESWPEEYIRSIESHAYGMCTDVKPESLLEKVLFTIDEMTGLVYATALMRPNKAISDMQVKSIKKKWKSKGFAAGVNREVVQKGADELGLSIEEVMQSVLDSMKRVSKEIGLDEA